MPPALPSSWLDRPTVRDRARAPPSRPHEISGLWLAAPRSTPLPVSLPSPLAALPWGVRARLRSGSPPCAALPPKLPPSRARPARVRASCDAPVLKAASAIAVATSLRSLSSDQTSNSSDRHTNHCMRCDPRRRRGPPRGARTASLPAPLSISISPQAPLRSLAGRPPRSPPPRARATAAWLTISLRAPRPRSTKEEKPQLACVLGMSIARGASNRAARSPLSGAAAAGTWVRRGCEGGLGGLGERSRRSAMLRAPLAICAGRIAPSARPPQAASSSRVPAPRSPLLQWRPS